MEEINHEWDGKGGNCPDPEGSSLPVRREEGGGTFMAMSPRDLAVPFLMLFLLGLVAGGVAALEILEARGYFNVRLHMFLLVFLTIRTQLKGGDPRSGTAVPLLVHNKHTRELISG